MNPLWLVLFSCKTFFSRRRCHTRELYVPSLWATSPVGQCLAGGICSSVGRWVAAPSETHPQRCGTSCSWLEHANFNGRSYASKPNLKSCLPCPAFVCSLLLFPLRLVLGQEDGAGGEGSLGRQQAAGAVAGLLALRGRRWGNPRAGAAFWLLWRELGSSVRAPYWSFMAARLRRTRRRRKALERAGGEQSCCPAPGLLPALQLRLSRFSAP